MLIVGGLAAAAMIAEISTDWKRNPMMPTWLCWFGYGPGLDTPLRRATSLPVARIREMLAGYVAAPESKIVAFRPRTFTS